MLDTQSYATKAEIAYKALRQAIADGRLRPGERVTIAQLAKQLGVSTMPVREALRQLAHEGLVDLTPHTGAVISTISVAEVREIFAVRAVLEGLAASAAAERMTPELLTPIGDAHTRMKAQLARRDFEAFGDDNKLLHDLILEAAGNAYLSHMMAEVWGKSFRFRAGYRIIRGRAQAAYEEHEAIIAALSNHDPIAAERAMRQHIERAGTELEEILSSGELESSDGRKQ